MRDFVSSWTHGADWRTWVAHSAIATTLTLILWWPLGLRSAGEVATGYYLLRELEQLLYGYVDRNLDPDWVDHVLDVAAPAAAVTLLLLLGGAL